MNNNFNLFINAGTKGEEINLKSKIFSNWIIEYYKSKNTKFFITNSFIILPICQRLASLSKK